MYLVKHRMRRRDVLDACPDADRRDDVRLRHRGRADRSGRSRSASCRRTRSTRASRPSTGSSSCGTSGCTAIAPRGAGARRDRRSSSGRAAASRTSATRVRQGFAILGDRRAVPALGDPVPQAISWVFRIAIALLLPEAFGVHRVGAQRAARAGRRLARDALPGDTGRRGHEAGPDRLPLPRPRRSRTRCCSRSASA